MEKQKKMKRILSWLLVAVMIISQLVSGKAITAMAAPESRAVTTIWRQFSAGANNNNGNNKALLFLTNQEAEGLTNGSIQMTIKTDENVTKTQAYFAIAAKNNTEFVGAGVHDTAWFIQNQEGAGSWIDLNRAGLAPGQEVTVKIRFNNSKLSLTVDGEAVKDSNGNTEFDAPYFESLSDGRIALLLGRYDKTPPTLSFKDVVISSYDAEGNETQIIKDGNDTWELASTDSGEAYTHETKTTVVTVTGKVVDKDNNALAGAIVTLGDKSTTTGDDGTYTFDAVKSGEYTVTASKTGYTSSSTTVTVEEEDIVVPDLVIKTADGIDYEAPETLKSSEMEVGIDNTFPRVIGYTLNGKKMLAQTTAVDTIKIGQTAIKPEVTFKKDAENKATYTMVVKDEEANIDAVLTATMTVEKNTLTFKITNVENKIANCVTTIDMSAVNFLSVRSTQSGAAFAGSNMSTNTHRNGDTIAEVSALASGTNGYMYAFVSADGLSAGLWSNSENNVTSDWQRVTSNVTVQESYKEAGLASTYWTYQKGPEYREENTEEELPCLKVALTEDQNGDEVVDWQDGAIAYRDIMNNPLGCELVPDRVALRIAMNFGSQAQNPFLMTLDNVKKVYLNTDGLGQSILLKGYGSEGHDSGHLNYADIGTRIGGVEGMKYLLEKGLEFGATFGIHVNASETYPESIYFDTDRLRKNADGSLSFGWNWLDQGVNINADYDLRNGRAQRFMDLHEKLGGDEGDMLDFIYVDVWGNRQSGDNGTWASRQLAKEITNCGWRVAGEWGYANAYDSTFQHWAADLTYGGYSLKGINSFIARFIANHQKDSWVGDYRAYGGAARNPLLGGYDMKDFEGWQGRNDYIGYINNLFDDDLASKFVQHYLVMKWENGTPVTMSDNGETYTWTPDMRITLQDEERENTLVIERQSNDVNNAGYDLRTMTFNGKKIMDGEKYLIPWFWDANGNDLASNDEKLYHWNQAGGTTTWELPDSWAGLSTVKLYTLSEYGKENETELAVTDNTITIEAAESTPYVIHKGTASPDLTDEQLNWSDGVHMKDTGFNSRNPLQYWTISGEKQAATVVKSVTSNNMLQLANAADEVALTQKLTDLKSGQRYAAYVGVDNRSDAKTYIEVSVDGKVVDSTYTQRSLAKNYVQADAHNTNCQTVANGGSYFQNMYVFFDVPEKGGEVTLTVRREAGEGAAYMDDFRVVETEQNCEEGNTFKQDFENVPQGIWPFVIGGVEGVQDNRTHLSEKHEPYTQAGWYDGVKKLDDVLEGNWSLKTNGLVQGWDVVYQTIPQNFRFEPGVTYRVTFDYETGSDDTYGIIIGDSEYEYDKFPIIPLKTSMKPDENGEMKGQKDTYTMLITGAENGQTWFGIYSTGLPADTQGTSGSAANFGGYKDFVLDNLVIEKSSVDRTKLIALVDANSNRNSANYSENTWNVFADALKAAQNVLDNFESTQAQIDNAYDTLDKAVKALDRIGGNVSGTVTNEAGAAVAGVAITIGDITAKTDSNGAYVLHGVPFGDQTIVAEDPQYVTVKESVTVTEEAADEKDVVKDFVLTEESTTVKGVVTAVGKPMAKATVKLTSGSYVQETVTNRKGQYEFNDVPTKDYTISVAVDGYDAVTKEFVAVKSEVAVVNLMLPPKSTADYENDYNDGEIYWADLAGNTKSTTIKSTGDANNILFQGGGHSNVYEKNAPEFKNGCVEMDLTTQADGIRLGILLRAKDMNNRVYVGVGDGASSYFTEYWGDKTGNSWSNMSAGPAFKAGETMHLKAEIVDKTITLWVNGEQILSNTMSGVQVESGAIGLNTKNTHDVIVDNVKVTSYDSPEGDVQTAAGYVSLNGNALEGAKVSIIDAEGSTVKETKTDVLGNYQFKKIPFGEYTVQAVNGAETKEAPVTIQATDGYCVVPELAFGEAPVPTKEVLEVVVDIYSTYEETDYTEESWTPFAEALAAAKAVLEAPEPTQAQIDDALDNVIIAASKLQKAEIPAVIDKNAVKIVAGIYGTYEEADYTEESWAPFAEALAKANEVIADEEATQEEVDAALKALTDAGEELVKAEKPAQVNKVGLEVAAKIYSTYKEADYTEESWKPFAEALAEANAVVANAEATQEEVDAALETVMSAASSLQKAEVVLPQQPLKISYRTHVQNVGWQPYVFDGEMSGTKGKGLRLEGIQIRLENNTIGGSVEYRTHVQNEGWQSYVADGAMAGTSGKGLRLEAIQVRLAGAISEKYDVYYRTHVQDLGWLGWAVNDGKSGTAGLSKRLEGIEIRLVEKGQKAPGSTDNAYVTNKKDPKPSISYTTHVQNIGWQAEVMDGAMSGTKGKGLRLEGIKIRVNGDGLKGGVEYTTHVQNIGWQSYVSNGAMSGTKGKGLRLEGIKIRLTGELAQKYSVEYRTHVQNEGWQKWVRDNAMSGTKGKGLRLEGIEIRLIKK
ncbi:MAG: endo-alpha-N-acetylgalactosaminidase family protein [Clostridiales bacterium]|nr:endo-alpha-N-acetylgalactosaminidase family protein [Clostridiales bacterium]